MFRFLKRLWRSPKQTCFVSELDTFMADMRAKMPVSPSQRQEIAKDQAIATRRDNKTPTDATKLWSEF